MASFPNTEDRQKPIILCVDDESIILQSLSHQLKREFGKEYDIELIEHQKLLSSLFPIAI